MTSEKEKKTLGGKQTEKTKGPKSENENKNKEEEKEERGIKT